jgi:predicted transcriptional regulator
VRIARTQLLKLVEELPETVEIEDVLYRLALRERLEAAEEDIREGRILSEDEVEAEIAQWFSE